MPVGIVTRLYTALENRSPRALKRLVPETWRIWLGYQIKVGRRRPLRRPFIHLSHPLTLPAGQSEQSLKAYLSAYYIEGQGPSEERRAYLDEAFMGYLYTLQLIPNGAGRLLEIGANPYFMSLLLTRFTAYDMTLINYFGDELGPRATQTLIGPEDQRVPMAFENVNVEADTLPYAMESFDVVLLCDVLEHLTNDPLHVLREIKRVLKPGGVFILKTPNVARLENVARVLAGENLHDPYSGYGPYGRHNREYTVAELRALLEHLGFAVDGAITLDVQTHGADGRLPAAVLDDLLRRRPGELGQHILLKATSQGFPANGRPRWLYRSYPPSELV